MPISAPTPRRLQSGWPLTGLLMAVIVLAGCLPAVLSEPLYTVAPAVDVRPPTPAPTVTPTVQPTITPLPTLTPYPSPLPTIVIPMPTRTAPITVTPAAGPVPWQLPDPCALDSRTLWCRNTLHSRIAGGTRRHRRRWVPLDPDGYVLALHRDGAGFLQLR